MTVGQSLTASDILPTFGALPLSAIERPAIRDWVAALAEEVSPRRTQNAYALIRHLLDEAVAEERLTRNPAIRIRLPQSVSPEVRPWTFDE